ncbi:MAG: hypothetical protein Q9219_006400 [cf. Caloplaca sp. 3 TL-2023]
MYPVSGLLAFCNLFLIATAAAPNATDNSRLSPSPKDILTLNPSHIPSLKDRRIRCDHATCGEPSAASCDSAISQMPGPGSSSFDHTFKSYGPRLPGIRQYNVELPKRFISSDGTCIIDITQSSYPSHERDFNLWTAANIIASDCINSGSPPWGGIAFQMGQEANLNMSMKAYRPYFTRCDRTPAGLRPTSKGCQSVLDTMRATTEPTRFGKAGVAGVDDQLPVTLNAREFVPFGAYHVDLGTEDDFRQRLVDAR